MNEDPDHDPKSGNSTSSQSSRRLETQSFHMSIDSLVHQWHDGQLLVPGIQREYVWSDQNASRLIESLLLNMPIPALYFAESKTGLSYEIIDGFQRVTSIVRFLNNEFPLTGLTVLTDPERDGKYYQDLSKGDQKTIRIRAIPVVIITADTHRDMVYEIFARLNAGAVALTAQELRSVTHHGPFMDLVDELVQLEVFRRCIGTRLPRKRMVDHELVVEIFAFWQDRKAYRGILQSFLNDYCTKKNEAPASDLADDRVRFERAALNVFAVFGEDSFRLHGSERARSHAVSNRLAITQLITLGSFETEMVKASSTTLRSLFRQLHATNDFANTFKAAANSLSVIERRLHMYQGILVEAGIAKRD